MEKKAVSELLKKADKKRQRPNKVKYNIE